MDPVRIKEICQRLEQLSTGEVKMRGRIYMEDLKVGMEGFPDLSKGGSLLDFVNKRAMELRQYFEASPKEVANSPEALMIKAYQEKMLAYANSLKSRHSF